ncbi:ABC transporter substrate-binding protein [Paenibacillus sp. IB182496]|uniref:ABC transporter substrate-binding protein n=1 Tax=Paenibacillus sabuli TaxID=2772509 RepID=A0A927BP49_9BACL|nr:ABC transporter substrate-binding protein [Paenibacillus sabuli]MBD2843682.1 ABC transporter substrate-binding protein [Paenibacillus sabuli]
MNNRYWRSALCVLLGILLALTTACSSGNMSDAGEGQGQESIGGSRADSNDGQAGDGTVERGEDVTAATKMVTDAMGREVEIPRDPQNVIALWTVGEMLALGQKPLGTSENLLRFYSEEERAGIAIVSNGTTGDYEKVLAMSPDLIMLSARVTEEVIAQYSKIAPTVTTPFYGDPIETFRTVADLLNKSDEAEQWLATYEARVEEKRRKVASLKLSEQSALVIQFALKNIYMYRSSTFPVIYQDYGFQLTAKQEELEQAPDFGSYQLAEEALPDFAADHIFVIVNDDESRPVYEELMQRAVWSGLQAVRDGQVYLIDNRLSINDVTTMDWALDEVERLLESHGLMD